MAFYTAFRYIHSKVVIRVVGPLLLLVLLASCGGQNPVTVPTPTAPPLALQVTTFDLMLPAAALNAPVVGPLPDNTVLHVSVTFKVNQQTLNQLNKQKKISTGQNQDLGNIANQLGISDSDYQKIKAFFGIVSATLNLNKLHTTLTVDAKAGSIAQLFQIKFVIHKLNGRTFYTPTTNPKIPTFIVSQVLAITGLDNYSLPAHKALTQGYLNNTIHHSTAAAAGKNHPAADCNFPNALTPSLIAHQYSYDQFYKAGLHGEGITINLIEIDGLVVSDVQNYLSCVNYQGHIKVVTINKAPPPGGEATADVEMIAGLAPAANIVDYQTDQTAGGDPFTLINDEFQQLINDNSKNTGSGSLVSVSLGLAEGFITPGDMTAIDQSLQILTKAEHMTVFIASGDCAAFTDQTFGDLTVSFPASDPWVVAVGGTAPIVNQSNKTISEVAWSDDSNRKACQNAWGSGGGLSQVFKRPPWQSGQVIQNKYANGFRQLPDVSAFAIPIAVYFQGQWTAFGGTSLATPIWASGMALVNEGLIQQTKSFYYSPNLFYGVSQVGASQHSQPFFDITQGNNLFYPATHGWDFATGLGSPNLVDFFNILLAAAKSGS